MTTTERVCIYTSIFEGFDDLKVPSAQSIACDYVCFTDDVHMVPAGPWRLVSCDDRVLPGANARMRSRMLKADSHRAMRELGVDYDFTIWVDASIRILRDTFAERFVNVAKQSGMALVPHPERDCIYDEAETSFLPAVAHKYGNERSRRQVQRYREQGYPARNGLLACGVIARDMRSDTVRRIDEEWCLEVCQGSGQDQLSLPYVLWSLGVEVGVVDLNLWRNPLFEVMPHLDVRSGGLMRQARAEYSAREFRVAANGDCPGTYVPDLGIWRLPIAEFQFGPRGRRLVPLFGDWDGDGLDSPGLYDPETATFFLRNECSAGSADHTFAFGPPHAVPVVGDWSGSGIDTAGVYLPSMGQWALRMCNEAGPADAQFEFGPRGTDSVPVVGDWDGAGRDRVGLYHPDHSSWFLSRENRQGADVDTFSFGPNNGCPVVGDWDGDGADEVGVVVVEQGQAFLADRNRASTPCSRTLVEPPGAWPVAGRWPSG